MSNVSAPSNIFTNYTTFESPHYNLSISDGDPTNSSNILSTIYGGDCDYMRLHFENITVVTANDTIMIWDQDNNSVDNFTGGYLDYMTPWYNVSEIQLTISSIDMTDNSWSYGYFIDYFQCVNDTIPPVYTSNNWLQDNDTAWPPNQFDGGIQQTANETYGWVQDRGTPDVFDAYDYWDGDFAELTQNLTIPRGDVSNAWVSMDYNIMHGFPEGDLYIYIAINGQEIFSKSFNQINNQGFQIWHNTQLIPLILWDNTTDIFTDSLNSMQTMNFSVGIKPTNNVEYSGWENVDLLMAAFKNVQLIFQTTANRTNLIFLCK